MSTKKELQRIRAALAARPKGPGRRITPEVRHWIACYAHRRAAEGASRVGVAREVGVSDETLVRVLKAEPADELVPVRVALESSCSPTVRGPGGLTIEGLDIEGLAGLIRALS